DERHLPERFARPGGCDDAAIDHDVDGPLDHDVHLFRLIALVEHDLAGAVADGVLRVLEDGDPSHSRKLPGRSQPSRPGRGSVLSASGTLACTGNTPSSSVISNTRSRLARVHAILDELNGLCPALTTSEAPRGAGPVATKHLSGLRSRIHQSPQDHRPVP